MLFETLGDKKSPAILFFHAMGVTGASSERAARQLCDKYFCIMPTSTVYCAGQRYIGKDDEIRQIENFLHQQGVESLSLVVASSIGADLAISFLKQTKLSVGHAFFDGGQFAQLRKATRRITAPLLYFAVKSLYWSNGRTLKNIIRYGSDEIKPYFIAAGRALKYGNLYRQLSDSLEDKPFPALPEKMQKNIYFEFGSREAHYKYRSAVMKAYPYAEYPIFEGHNHMQYQICNPRGFAEMLCSVAENGSLPKLPFLKK